MSLSTRAGALRYFLVLHSTLGFSLTTRIPRPQTCRPTTHDKPTFVVEDVLHYCVANMPGAVPITSTNALNNATLPFGLQLANEGWVAAAR